MGIETRDNTMMIGHIIKENAITCTRLLYYRIAMENVHKDDVALVAVEPRLRVIVLLPRLGVPFRCLFRLIEFLRQKV